MTPQLQQAIKLLQLSRLELVELVQQELEENPVLEEAIEGDDEPAQASSAEAAVRGRRRCCRARREPALPELAAAEPAASSEREPTDAEKLADVDWQSYAEDYPQTGPREAREDAERPLPRGHAHAARATLAEHLQWQLQLSGFPPDEEIAAQFIIGNLDERGYLAVEPRGDRAPGRRAARPWSRRRCAAVQEFDPTGVARARPARVPDCSRCARWASTTRSCCAILAEALDPLIKRDFRGVARAARDQRRGGRGRVAHRRPARAAAGPRVRRRGPGLHRARHLRAQDRRRVPRRAERRRPAAPAHQRALPRGARARQRDAARTPRPTCTRRSARRCG